MQTPPMVSVIIPTHNRAWCLKEAIDSVLAQDFTDLELIVVDDGSTDGTSAVLANYGAGHRMVVRQQANQGVSAARNLGIAAARGEYIAFLDSDDLWLPSKLSVQIAYFQANPDALICQTEETWIRNGRHVNPKQRHRKRSGMIFEPSLALCLVSPSAVMAHRRLFDTVGVFDERLPACEDYDLWLRVSCRHPVHLIPIPLIVKRGGHPDQLSRRPSLDRYRILSLCKLLENGQLNRRQHRATLQMLQKKYAIYAAGCMKRGRRSEAGLFAKLVSRYNGLSAALTHSSFRNRVPAVNNAEPRHPVIR